MTALPSLDDAAQALGLPLTAPQRAALEGYLDLLLRWNSTFNLTSVRTREAMQVQHLFDCLAVVPALIRQAAESSASLLDVGSGGGLPGVVLAICLPGWRVECVDAVGKKAAFVRQVAAELGLVNLVSTHARVERLRGREAAVVCSRAFSSLSEFVSATRSSLRPGGVWMAMKGRVPEDEIAGLPADIEAFHVEQLKVPALDAQRCIVWMRPAACGSSATLGAHSGTEPPEPPPDATTP